MLLLLLLLLASDYELPPRRLIAVGINRTICKLYHPRSVGIAKKETVIPHSLSAYTRPHTKTIRQGYRRSTEQMFEKYSECMFEIVDTVTESAELL